MLGGDFGDVGKLVVQLTHLILMRLIQLLNFILKKAVEVGAEGWHVVMVVLLHQPCQLLLLLRQHHIFIFQRLILMRFHFMIIKVESRFY